MANEIVKEIVIRGRTDLSQMQGELAKVENNFKSSFGRIEATSKSVSGSLRPLASSFASLVGATGPLASALGNVVTSFGPLGLAVGGAVFAISTLTRAWSDAKRSAEEFKKAMADQGARLHDLNTDFLLMTGAIDEAEAALRRFYRSQQALAVQAKQEEVERIRAIVNAIPKSPLAGVGRALGIEGIGRRMLGFDLERAERELAVMKAHLDAEAAATVRNVRGRQKQVIPKQERDDVEQFIKKLKADLDRLEQKRVEITIGTDAALDLRLTQELEALKEKLGGKLISEENLARIQELADKMRAADREVRQITESLKALEHLDFEDMERGAKAMGEMERAAGKNAEALRRQVEELQKTMGMEVLPPEDQAQARIRAELQERLKLIQDWVNAQRESGRDVELINAQAAEATRQAWEASYKKMAERADEFTEFQRRAFHRMHDALANITNDALGGQIKSWEDLGNRVKRVIDSIVSEFLAMQLKIGLFGKDYGKPGGNVGGIIGWLMGSGGPSEAPWILDGTIFHEGGKVGVTSAPKRKLPAVTFADAPTLHDGGRVREVAGAVSPRLGPDEVPAILKTGELVLTEKQARAFMGMLREPAINARVFHQGGKVDLGIAPMLAVNRSFFNGAPRLHDGSIPGLEDLSAPQIASGAPGERGGGEVHYHFTFNGVDNMDSFRRSRPQLLSDLSRAVQKGNKHL